MELTKQDYINISYIFYPKDNYKIPFTSKWEHTRENIGRHIAEEKFPVSFPHIYYFALYEYYRSRVPVYIKVIEWFKIKYEQLQLQLC